MTPVKRSREEPVERPLEQKRPKMEGQSLEKLKRAFEEAHLDKSTLLQSYHHFLSNYKNPARADEIRELARGALSPLNDYADQVQLPHELLQKIVTLFVESVKPEEAGALRQTSKQVRRFALEAHGEALTRLNIKTGDQVVAFVQEVGAGLTYLNLDEIDLSETQLGIIFPILKKLQTLSLTLGPNCAREIAETQIMTQLRRVSLIIDDEEEDMPLLVNSTALRNLESLTLGGSPLEDSSAHFIARSFANLRFLDLSIQLIEDAGAIAIAQSQTLTNLETLDLSKNCIHNEGAIAIARSPTLAKLQHLFLGTEVGEAGAIAIAQSQTLKNLQTLSLASFIGDRGVIAIAESQTLTNLRNLYLEHEVDGINDNTNIGVEGAKAIARSLTLTNLRSLSFSDSSLGDEGATALALSASLGNLTMLDLDRCDIGNSGLLALANSPTFKLKSLSFICNSIDDEGVLDFAQSQQLQGLKILTLTANALSDASATALAQSHYLQNIELLNLSDNNISDGCGAALTQSLTLRKVRFHY